MKNQLTTVAHETPLSGKSSGVIIQTFNKKLIIYIEILLQIGPKLTPNPIQSL